MSERVTTANYIYVYAVPKVGSGFEIEIAHMEGGLHFAIIFFKIRSYLSSFALLLVKFVEFQLFP